MFMSSSCDSCHSPRIRKVSFFSCTVFSEVPPKAKFYISSLPLLTFVLAILLSVFNEQAKR